MCKLFTETARAWKLSPHPPRNYIIRPAARPAYFFAISWPVARPAPHWSGPQPAPQPPRAVGRNPPAQGLNIYFPVSRCVLILYRARETTCVIQVIYQVIYNQAHSNVLITQPPNPSEIQTQYISITYVNAHVRKNAQTECITFMELSPLATDTSF